MDISRLFKKLDSDDFITFPSTLETYSWYKPFLVLILSLIIGTALSSVAALAIPGSISFDNPYFELYTFLTLILFIPGFYISTKLIYKIPFSSQLTYARKWNWKAYAVSVAVALVVYIAFYQITNQLSGFDLNKVSTFVLIAAIILPFFQGFSEEYMFRGFLMQTLGSWFRIPVLAILLQALIFGVLHGQYNLAGMGAVFITGLVYGLLVYHIQGLEVSSALHGVNNAMSFLAVLCSVQTDTGDVSSWSVVSSILLLLIPVCIIILINKKFDFFALDKDV